MTNRTDARKQFLTYILSTAVEGGINYWSQVSDYHWDCPLGEATVTVYESEEMDDDGEYPADYTPHVVTIDTIASGIRILTEQRKDHDPKSYWHQFIIANRTNGEDGDYDATTADDILQAGIFNEVVYG